MSDASLSHLLTRVRALEGLVRRAVDRRRAGDPAPDDPFRGLYLSHEHIDRLFDEPAEPAVPDEDFQAEEEAIEAAADRLDGVLRLRLLAAAFGLTDMDVRLLLVALAPDVEPRFERFYGYLNDDVTRRRATIGLALELAGGAPAQAADRARVGRLADAGLVIIEDADRPYL
ncbi:MAG: ATP-binding protein, partial [Actinomycetota bacterium]|nr:ATP-binding protein [Actinomycetota bacterium]